MFPRLNVSPPSEIIAAGAAEGPGIGSRAGAAGWGTGICIVRAGITGAGAEGFMAFLLDWITGSFERSICSGGPGLAGLNENGQFFLRVTSRVGLYVRVIFIIGIKYRQWGVL